MNYDIIAGTAGHYGAKVLFDKEIAGFTSFGIGGVCDVILFANCRECLVETVKACKENGIAYHIFGKCTNVLISGNGLRGVVIIMSDDSIVFDGCSMICGAGAPLMKICTAAKEHNLSGLEFAYGIPGSAGGALCMNAGAYGGEMKDVVKYCDYLDSDGVVKRMENADMELSYRHSVFSEGERVVLSVCFELREGNVDEITAKMKDVMQKRREKQPLEYPSAGSTFKRPKGYFAAKLIEDSGLKGYTVGGAQVSEKHSGFVINKGNATFDDVVKIIDDIKSKVYSDSGVRLECEVLIVE